jgi:hypothetical protein
MTGERAPVWLGRGTPEDKSRGGGGLECMTGLAVQEVGRCASPLRTPDVETRGGGGLESMMDLAAQEAGRCASSLPDAL